MLGLATMSMLDDTRRFRAVGGDGGGAALAVFSVSTALEGLIEPAQFGSMTSIELGLSRSISEIEKN